MNSLMKLKIYSESDSEEEVNLQASSNSQLLPSLCYNNATASDLENLGNMYNINQKLPLPGFLGRSAAKRLHSKEVNEEGKLRNFPHEPGNWVTYMYIPVDSTEFLNYLNALLLFFKPLDLKLSDDFHISLTKTFILRHHWIPDFISSVKNCILEVNSFKIHLFGLKAYINEQKTRSFLSLKVDVGENDLLSIICLLKQCFIDYNLEGFYDDPSFHLSLLWCPGNKFSEINKYIDMLPVKLKNFGFYYTVSYCVCAAGNKKFTFNFC